MTKTKSCKICNCCSKFQNVAQELCYVKQQFSLQEARINGRVDVNIDKLAVFLISVNAKQNLAL